MSSERLPDIFDYLNYNLSPFCYRKYDLTTGLEANMFMLAKINNKGLWLQRSSANNFYV